MRKIAFKPVLLTEKADIFSIWINDNPFTEFQKFVICFKGSSDPFIADDLERILASIRTIGNKGALENQSRPEGQLKDRVVALPLLVRPRDKETHGTLRLYCIRISEHICVVLQGLTNLSFAGCTSKKTIEEEFRMLKAYMASNYNIQEAE